ncbi:hypothetical protein RRG08_055055 [Elysia crispata]|uniref:Uncharacterized protein n=1 Tax=Elysia crispata TaxID=231223 RepID=A0AAE1B0D6_9GAST|nr:hypothetical protein RRG08_055055 [Elysia crispata]
MQENEVIALFTSGNGAQYVCTVRRYHKYGAHGDVGIGLCRRQDWSDGIQPNEHKSHPRTSQGQDWLDGIQPNEHKSHPRTSQGQDWLDGIQPNEHKSHPRTSQGQDWLDGIQPNEHKSHPRTSQGQDCRAVNCNLQTLPSPSVTTRTGPITLHEYLRFCQHLSLGGWAFLWRFSVTLSHRSSLPLARPFHSVRAAGSDPQPQPGFCFLTAPAVFKQLALTSSLEARRARALARECECCRVAQQTSRTDSALSHDHHDGEIAADRADTDIIMARVMNRADMNNLVGRDRRTTLHHGLLDLLIAAQVSHSQCATSTIQGTALDSTRRGLV